MISGPPNNASVCSQSMALGLLVAYLCRVSIWIWEMRRLPCTAITVHGGTIRETFCTPSRAFASTDADHPRRRQQRLTHDPSVHLRFVCLDPPGASTRCLHQRRTALLAPIGLLAAPFSRQRRDLRHDSSVRPTPLASSLAPIAVTSSVRKPISNPKLICPGCT
ncbi:hypothetical protein ACLOJK_023477 [Asimina triloba]